MNIPDAIVLRLEDRGGETVTIPFLKPKKVNRCTCVFKCIDYYNTGSDLNGMPDDRRILGRIDDTDCPEHGTEVW